MSKCELGSGSSVCPGGAMEKLDRFNSKGKRIALKCKYCWNCRNHKRRESVYRCKGCKVSLCTRCQEPYHEWLKYSVQV